MSLVDLASLATIAQLILWIVVTFGASIFAIGYISKMRPVWRRFVKNIDRQVAVISTEAKTMDHEAELLMRIGYFKKIKHILADKRNIDLIDGSALIVIGYSPKSLIYKLSFEYAKSRRLPFIVLSGEYRLTNKDMRELKEYSFGSICETELRLISDVFTVMSTFPEQEL